MFIEEKKNSQIFQDSNHLSPTSESEVSELIKEAYKKNFQLISMEVIAKNLLDIMFKQPKA